VEDGKAYLQILKEHWPNVPAFPMFVAFHNLVSSSIGAAYKAPGRNGLHCAKTVRDALRPEFFDDLPPDPDADSSATNQQFEMFSSVPGFGRHDKLNCEQKA